MKPQTSALRVFVCIFTPFAPFFTPFHPPVVMKHFFPIPLHFSPFLNSHFSQCLVCPLPGTHCVGVCVGPRAGLGAE